MKLGISIASLVLLGTACGVVPASPDSTGERARVSVQAGTGTDQDSGSGADVPAFPASMSAMLRGPEVEPPGTPCGPSRCKVGQFCCNESCGLCAPRGGICPQRQCGPTASILTECTDDSGCRAVSSYCDGCQCLPAGLLDPDPSCHATMVACILDPCHHQHPACVNGKCAIMDD